MGWKNVQYDNGKFRTSEGGGGGGSSTFAGLDDVNFSNIQNGQVPKYNSTTQKWENADESGGGGRVQRNIYLANGQILKSSSTNVSGLGMATVDIVNEIARVDFTLKITNTSGSNSDFDWGISIEKLREINPNIPNIKPIQGGYYYTDQWNNSELVGYGCMWSPTIGDKYWIPARYYTTSGDLGGWASNIVRSNCIWFGCCFGEVI